jgi:hypothetical protein
MFWDVVPCNVAEVDWRFRGTCCLHHQRNESLIAAGMRIWNIADKIRTAYILSLGIEGGDLETKGNELNDSKHLPKLICRPGLMSRAGLINEILVIIWSRAATERSVWWSSYRYKWEFGHTVSCQRSHNHYKINGKILRRARRKGRRRSSYTNLWVTQNYKGSNLTN